MFFICRNNGVNDLVCARNVVGTLVLPCVSQHDLLNFALTSISVFVQKYSGHDINIRTPLGII
jgi:hypothetical protein